MNGLLCHDPMQLSCYHNPIGPPAVPCLWADTTHIEIIADNSYAVLGMRSCNSHNDKDQNSKFDTFLLLL